MPARYYSVSKFNLFFFNIFITCRRKLQNPYKVYKFLANFKFGIHLNMFVCPSLCLSSCLVPVLNILPFAKMKTLLTNFRKILKMAPASQRKRLQRPHSYAKKNCKLLCFRVLCSLPVKYKTYII